MADSFSSPITTPNITGTTNTNIADSTPSGVSTPPTSNPEINPSGSVSIVNPPTAGNVSIITPDKAVADVNKIATEHATITQGMKDQAAKVAATNANAATTAANQKQTDLTNKQNQDKIDADKAKADALSKAKGTAATTPTSAETTKTPTSLADAVAQVQAKGITDPQAIFHELQTHDYGMVAGALNGYSSDTLPTKTGTTGTDQAQADINNLDSTRAALDAKMTKIENGQFALSPDEQAQVNSLKAQYQGLIDDQKVANQNYTSGITQLGITSGRSRYSGELEMGNITNSINVGIQKISKIENDMNDAVYKMTEAFKTNDYNMISKQYDRLTSQMNEKKATIKDIADTVQKATDNANKKITDQLNQDKLKFEVGKEKLTAALPAISETLTGDVTKDQKTISDMASYYGLTEAEVLGQIQSYKDTQDAKTAKQDETMSLKGYATINPSDAGKMKAQGYDVQTIGGRAYAKAPAAQKLTHSTYKGVTTFYDAKGNVVNKSGGGGGGNNTKTNTDISKGDAEKLNQALGAAVGPDGHVSPQDYAAARKSWIGRGGTPTSFDSKMKGYRDPNNPNYGLTKKTKSNILGSL